MGPEKTFKSYSQFVNESFFPDDVAKYGKKAISAIKKFVGAGAKYLDSLVYQVTGKRSKYGEDGTIPYGVTIFPSDYDKKELEKAGIPAATPPLPQSNEESPDLDEAVVPLDFPNPNADVKNVGMQKMMVTIKRVLKHPDERPLMIWGAPGIGKTAIVKLVQKQFGGRLIDVQLTTYQPEDFFLPEKDPGTEGNLKSRRATRIPQGWLPLYHESEGEAGNAAANGPDGRGGVIFLDELSRAKEAIRNICLKFILDRELDGGWKIGSMWRILAASNRQEDDETNSAEFGSALGNRFQQLNFSPSVKDFSEYALDVKDESGTNIFDPRIISFLNWTKGQEFFHKLDPMKSATIFPSPRSWEAAAVAWKNTKADAAEEGVPVTPDDIEDVLSFSVGKTAAAMFMGYYNLSTKIELDKLGLVYTNPEQAPLPPKKRGGDQYELDSAHILASAISYEHRDRKITAAEFENVVKYVVRVHDPTVAMQILQAVLDIHPYLNADKKTKPDSMIDDYFRILTRWFLPAYPGSAREIEALAKGQTPNTINTQNNPR
jgi:hypothetical protein